MAAKTQIQMWPFGSGASVCCEIASPAKARRAVRRILAGRNAREVCIWHHDYTVTHADRKAPDAPWRTIKGALPT